MKELAEEINKLIDSISQTELRKNPRLKAKIKMLLNKTEAYRKNCKPKNTGFDLSNFINKKMLLS